MRRPGLSSSELPALDGLRAVAILLVLMSHSLGPMSQQSYWVNIAFKHGGLGVRLFFIISGFLITTLCLREQALHGNLSLKRFYARRGLRILPAAYLYIACLGVLALVGIVHAVPVTKPDPYYVVPGAWPYALTWTVNYHRWPGWLLAHHWSLSVEEQFYLVWPIVLAIATRRGWVAVAATFVLAPTLLHSMQVFAGVTPFDLQRYPNAFPLVASPIAMGCLLAIYWPACERLVRRLPAAVAPMLFVVVLVLDATNEGYVGRYQFLAIPLLDAALLVCIARWVAVSDGPTGRLFDVPAVRFVGRLSYSLYLWQQLWLWRMDRPWQTTALAWVALAGCALVSYYAVERPLIGVRRRLRRVSVAA